MANILDYLKWRGDLPFSSVPFNEVDNLILSELSYIDYVGILPEDFMACMTLRDAAKCLSHYRKADTVELGMLLPRDLLPLFWQAAESRRFGEILLCGFETRVDAETETQFAAVTMLLGDGTAFVAYRGTDDTLVGWKEDFNMAFLPVVPAQSYAVRYLDRMAKARPEAIRLGGHSKGGNLAVYAAACAAEDTQKRILTVYSNDGPGFSRGFLESVGYLRIRDRVRTIVPQNSVVGMLMEHECAHTVVQSTQSGLYQHDGFSWEVLGGKFVHLEDRTAESKRVDRTLKGWIAGLDEAEREQFVTTLYEILSSHGAETLSDIRGSADGVLKIIRGITKEQRTVLQKSLRNLLYAGQQVMREDRDEKREEKRIQKERAEEERRERQRVEAEVRLRKKKRREALMVAVRPIRFHIVTAKAPISKRSAPSSDEGDTP